MSSPEQQQPAGPVYIHTATQNGLRHDTGSFTGYKEVPHVGQIYVERGNQI